jgi:AraC family transcriptional regulator, transcriptional activator of pobA
MTQKIPTLKPDTFKKLLMADIDHFQLDKPHFNDFYIHDLSKDTYKLKLPLPPHRKTVNDFIVITSGTMTKSSGIYTHKVSKNSIFVLPVGQITTTISISKNLKGFYCHFSNAFISDNKSQIDILNHFSFLDWLNNPILNLESENVDILINLLKRIENIYNNQTNYELIKCYLLTFLTELKTIQKSIPSNSINATQRIAFDFKYILSKHIIESHQVDFYAKKLNISPNHLNRCVKEIFEKSATHLIAEMLLLEAKVLLYQPSISISEVSFAIGFEDPSYFGRFFKKQTGQTPTEYRRIIDLSE